MSHAWEICLHHLGFPAQAVSLLSSVGSSLVFNSVPSTRGSASELDPNPLEMGSALLKLREGMGRPRKTLHPPPLCSSGEDRLAKGRLAPAGLHNGRRAPHRTGRKTGGPGAATRWPVPPERGQRVLCIQPDGEGWAPAPPGTLPGSPGLGSPAVTSLSGPLLTDFPVLGWDWVSLVHLLQLGFQNSSLTGSTSCHWLLFLPLYTEVGVFP